MYAEKPCAFYLPLDCFLNSILTRSQSHRPSLRESYSLNRLTMAKDVNSTVWSSEIAESLLIAIKTFPQVLIVIIISLFVLVPRRRTSSTGKSKVIKPYAIRVECIPLGYPHENLQNELENIVNGDLDLKNGVKRILHHFLSQKDQRFACATATFFTSLSPDELTRKLTNGSTRLSLGYCFDVDFFGITPLYDSFQVDDIE